MPAQPSIGRRYAVRGRVQGVGFRDFVQREARQLALTGYVRNLPDGSVLVCAMGDPASLEQLEATLRQGVRWSEVHAVLVEEMEFTESFDEFRIVL